MKRRQWLTTALVDTIASAMLGAVGGRLTATHQLDPLTNSAFLVLALLIGGHAAYCWAQAFRTPRTVPLPPITPTPLPADLTDAAEAVAHTASLWGETMLTYAQKWHRKDYDDAVHTASLTAMAALQDAGRLTTQVRQRMWGLDRHCRPAAEVYLAVLVTDLITRQDWNALTGWWRHAYLAPTLPPPPAARTTTTSTRTSV